MTINVKAIWQTIDNKCVVNTGTIDIADIPWWCRDRLKAFCENHQISTEGITYAAYLSDIGSKTDDDVYLCWYTDESDIHRIITGDYWPGQSQSQSQIQTTSSTTSSNCIIN